MATGFGIDPTKNGSGVVTSGTTSTDIRNITNALYTPGLIKGGAVSTSTTGMTYSISAGVAAIRISSTEVVLAPIPAITIPTDPGSARTDVIYAKQNVPSIDGNSDVVVDVATTLPARAVALQYRTVRATDTKTSTTVVGKSIDYSIPYGASLGILHRSHMNWTGGLINSVTRYGHGTFSVPTDRQVRFSLTGGALYAQGAVGFDNSKYVEMGFLPNIDGGDMVLWTTPGLHQSFQTISFSRTINVNAGTHTTNFGIFRAAGPGTGMMYTGTLNGFGRDGLIYTVEDVGPVI